MSISIRQEGRRFVLYIDGQPTSQFAYTRDKAQALAQRVASASRVRRNSVSTGRELWPSEAYEQALKEGPSDETRAAAMQDPGYAFFYAQAVDKKPRDDTRAAAMQDPGYAYDYAKSVDKRPRDDTRAAALQDPYSAYHYAEEVDKRPRDDTRAAALRDPKYAYYYAAYVDEKPRDDTRAAALRDPYWAYEYAKNVDEKPRDDTRAAALQDPYSAYRYAEEVDKRPRDDTRAAAMQHPEYAYLYAKFVDRRPRDDTWEAAQRDVKVSLEYAKHFGLQLPDYSVKTDFNPAFWRWFGKSKIVDASGRPKMLFHGSPEAGFSAFDTSKIDAWHPGFFFTDDLQTALSYTPRGKFDPFDAEQGVYRVYVKMENPLVVDAQGSMWNSIPFNRQEVKTDDIGHYAKEQGYDGAIIHNVVDVGNYADDLDFGPQTIYIVFDPRNIKSAAYNRGTWDPSDADIRKNPRRPRLRRLRR